MYSVNPLFGIKYTIEAKQNSVAVAPKVERKVDDFKFAETDNYDALASYYADGDKSGFNMVYLFY